MNNKLKYGMWMFIHLLVALVEIICAIGCVVSGHYLVAMVFVRLMLFDLFVGNEYLEKMEYE